ncbi:acyltransferase family protein [Prosthecobacter sp.]|uniref:acyltransferase family protein n=1 Tax=Prosthecobacter sp. TaxID=1965333 RepID=UPI0037CACCE6
MNIELMKIRPKLPRLDEFDGLRGLLASWVALSHILLWCGFAGLKFRQPFGRGWGEFIFAMSAVETFIILSGFAISFLLHSREQSYWTFIRGRFFRIYPVYLVCLILGVCVIGITPVLLKNALWQDASVDMMRSISESERTHFLPHLLGHLTLLHGLTPKKLLLDATGTLLSPAWSISLEWQYYLVAPFVALWVRSSSRLLIIGMVAFLGTWYGSRWLNNPHPASFLVQLPLFLVGIGSYHLYAHFCSSAASEELGKSRRYAVAVVAFAWGAILFTKHSLALTIWALAFGSVLVKGPGLVGGILGIVRRILVHPWLQKLGHISYPLYLVHWPVIFLCLYLFGRWKPDLTRNQLTLGMLIVASPLILLVSSCLHKWVEAPLMKPGKGRRKTE